MQNLLHELVITKLLLMNETHVPSRTNGWFSVQKLKISKYWLINWLTALLKNWNSDHFSLNQRPTIFACAVTRNFVVLFSNLYIIIFEISIFYWTIDQGKNILCRSNWLRYLDFRGVILLEVSFMSDENETGVT